MVSEQTVLFAPLSNALWVMISGNLKQGDRNVCILFPMVIKETAVIHFIDMVPGKDQRVAGPVTLDEIEILTNTVRRAPIPVMTDALLGRHNFEKMPEPVTENIPAGLQMIGE